MKRLEWPLGCEIFQEFKKPSPHARRRVAACSSLFSNRVNGTYFAELLCMLVCRKWKNFVLPEVFSIHKIESMKALEAFTGPKSWTYSEMDLGPSHLDPICINTFLNLETRSEHTRRQLEPIPYGPGWIQTRSEWGKQQKREGEEVGVCLVLGQNKYHEGYGVCLGIRWQIFFVIIRGLKNK